MIFWDFCNISVEFPSLKIVNITWLSSLDPPQFPNNLSSRILGNYEIWTELGNCIKYWTFNRYPNETEFMPSLKIDKCDCQSQFA